MDVNKAIIDKLATFLPDDKKPIMERLGDDLSKLMSGDPTFKPKTWKGYRFYPGFEPESAKHMYDDKKFEENCVAICTFAKTGTTWVMQIVYNILYGHDEKLDEIAKLLIQPVTYFEFMKAYKYEATDHIPLPRRVYGTHLAAELVNVEKIKKAKGKVICVVRNPKDQLVSLFHFLQTVAFEGAREEIPKNWPDFFQAYVEGKLPLNSREGEWYIDYLIGWNKYRGDENFLFLTFEEMKRDYKQEIRRIAEFLDVKITNERIEEIVRKTDFETMKKGSETDQSEGMHSFAKQVNLFRKGKVGSWKETFTVAQSELMDRLIAEKLPDADIKFIYE